MRRMTDAKERLVPCGTCQACCRREWIVLDPAAGDVVEIYETVEVVDPRSGRAAEALAHQENGDCVYLGPEGCTIHSYRPRICRQFDCRVHYRSIAKKPAHERNQALRESPNLRELYEIGRAMQKKHPLAEE